MIRHIDAALRDYAELLTKLGIGNGYNEESLTYRIMREGDGVTIKSTIQNNVPIQHYKVVRFMVKIQKIIGEMSKPDKDIIDINYKVFVDPRVDGFPRHLMSLYPKRTFYNRLHKIHEHIDQNIRKMKIIA